MLMMARRRMEPWGGLLRAMRPRQWVKNLLVLLPLLFAVNLVWFPAEPGTLLRHTPALGLLFAAFARCRRRFISAMIWRIGRRTGGIR